MMLSSFGPAGATMQARLLAARFAPVGAVGGSREILAMGNLE
jgi:hypothetical protein